ncbi:BMC domain-containing protein [Clostridium estertheticum]|uniref:BMC domain-containing protein n=1 Tax=Clostridium estertheticum TaxID=238834 RepID=UPI0013E92791|nr:BMC domain-containing protein [Clostridium estertheticum]MBZ9685815.1 BMC domain-containing protein [Clostridium estertheticum]
MQALGLIETKGLIAAIESADAMLKAADVNLLEKTYVGGGLVSIIVTGDVGAVKAAVEAGGAAVRKINSALLVSEHVIPRPHEELEKMIIPAAPLKNVEISTDVSAKTESEEEVKVEIIEEDTVEVPVEGEEIVFENLVVEDSEGTEFLAEKTATSLEVDLCELYNKEAVDKMVLEYGLEEAIKILSKFKVIELRNLARQYKNFGIAGRRVSKANKILLLTEFRKYYGNN